MNPNLQPGSSRQRVFEVFGTNGSATLRVAGAYEKWLPEEEAMFGIVPDREITKITGRSLSVVKGKKFALLKDARGKGLT